MWPWRWAATRSRSTGGPRSGPTGGPGGLLRLCPGWLVGDAEGLLVVLAALSWLAISSVGCSCARSWSGGLDLDVLIPTVPLRWWLVSLSWDAGAAALEGESYVGWRACQWLGCWPVTTVVRATWLVVSSALWRRFGCRSMA
jgi:hypothetical protein